MAAMQPHLSAVTIAAIGHLSPVAVVTTHTAARTAGTTTLIVAILVLLLLAATARAARVMASVLAQLIDQFLGLAVAATSVLLGTVLSIVVVLALVIRH